MLELWVCWHRVKCLSGKGVTNMWIFSASFPIPSGVLLDKFHITYFSNKPWAPIFLSRIIRIWPRECCLGIMKYMIRGWKWTMNCSCSLFMVLPVLPKVPVGGDGVVTVDAVVTGFHIVSLTFLDRITLLKISKDLCKLKYIYAGKWVLPKIWLIVFYHKVL